METNAGPITGSVNEDLLRRIECLLEENRVLRNQIDSRILLTDNERCALAPTLDKYFDPTTMGFSRG